MKTIQWFRKTCPCCGKEFAGRYYLYREPIYCSPKCTAVATSQKSKQTFRKNRLTMADVLHELADLYAGVKNA